jgi:hypothetical protein
MPLNAAARKISFVIIVIAVLVIAGGAVFLATWNIPPPTKPVEKVIPDAKLPR